MWLQIAVIDRDVKFAKVNQCGLGPAAPEASVAAAASRLDPASRRADPAKIRMVFMPDAPEHISGPV